MLVLSSSISDCVRRIRTNEYFRRYCEILLRVRNKLLVLLVVLVLSLLLFWAAQVAGKTLWEWLELLFIPLELLLLAVGYYWARKADRNNMLDKERQDTLEKFFDRMTALLLDHRVHEFKESSEIRSVAQAATLSTLRNLDGQRKGEVLQFLHQSGLISCENSVIKLNGADLKEARLKQAELEGADLKQAELERADLTCANLMEANLEGANLKEAYLEGAHLHGAHIEKAYMTWAHMNGAYLCRAHLDAANLNGADLNGADLSEAHLENAILRWTKLKEADLRQADLKYANLTRAKLKKANLRQADLTKAIVTPKQLLAAALIEDAIMPDGTKYKKWVARGKPDWSRRVGEPQIAGEPGKNGSETQDEP